MIDYEQQDRRRFLNVLVTGHRRDRMDKAGADVAGKVENALGQVLDRLLEQSGSHERRMRLFSGSADGVDEMAWNWWKSQGSSSLDYYCVSPTPPFWAQDRIAPPTGIVAIAPTPPENGDIPESWHGITDDYKLLMADLVVSVWDGRPARGCEGGTVRLIQEALRRNIPVLWIRADSGHGGELAMGKTRVDDVGTSSLLEIAPDLTPDLFASFRVDDLPELVQRICLLAINHSGRRMAEADPKQRKTVAGFWHTLFFHLLSKQWRIKPPYSAVQEWRGPDPFVNASQLGYPFWQSFDGLDRAATHYANLHRDAVVWSHLLSSLAVFAAVAGAIVFLAAPDSVWGSVELLTLLGVAAIVWYGQPRKRRAAWRDLWMLGRQAAEAMRVSALLYPQMASLPALYHLSIRQEGSEKNPATQRITIDVNSQARMLVIQSLRDTEAPRGENGRAYFLADRFGPLQSALQELLQDQIGYHRKTAHKYEMAHRHLKWLTNGVFFLALATVVLHLAGVLGHVHWVEKQSWLLFLTAFFPALAAALESIAIEFELGRLARNSERMQEKLQTHLAMTKTLQSKEDFLKLRHIAIATAVSIYADHDGWVGLMDIHQLGIPA